MTAKARDRCNRWRNVTVAFRMSPEENEHLNHLVQLSGMTKQDYIIARLLQKEIVVHGNPRVYHKRGESEGSALFHVRGMNCCDKISPLSLLDLFLSYRIYAIIS